MKRKCEKYEFVIFRKTRPENFTQRYVCCLKFSSLVLFFVLSHIAIAIKTYASKNQFHIINLY